MIFQSIKMAWKAISSSKMRSFLTMLGIIIGVVALVVLVSIATSATSSVTDKISSLGNNMLTAAISDDKGNPLTLEELNELTDYSEFEMAAPYGQASVTAKYEYNNDSATIYGTTAAYYDIQGLELASGRFLKTADVENNSYVAVVSASVAEDLLETNDVIGKTISLDGTKFQIVGLLAEDDSLTASAMNSGMKIYIPFTTAARLSDTFSDVSSFYIMAADEDNLDLAEAALTSYLLSRFERDEEAFTIVNQTTIQETMASVTNTMAIMLGGIAAISLLVGGIGIMNIMLVSVTERTREIGIRKAIGAEPGSIMLQFLIEALVVSLMGCAIGILLSVVIIQIATIVAGDTMTFHLSYGVVIIAVTFSLAIGVIFGIYPARKAAKKRPIEALRYDG